MDDASYRVSDAEREQAVAVLRDHLMAGRLTLDEFSERVEAALGARFGADLARVQQDLPPTPAPSRRAPTRFTAALFGHVVRRGRLRLRRRTLAASAFGDLDLDLREAAMDGPRATLTVLALCGNADIYVPVGVDVDVSGVTVLGHHRDWGRDAVAADAPAITVRVFGVLGTLDVWRVPHGMREGTFSDIIRHLEGRPPRTLR